MSPRYPDQPPAGYVTCIYFVTGDIDTRVELEIKFLLISAQSALIVGNGHNTGEKNSKITEIKLSTPPGELIVSQSNKIWIAFVGLNLNFEYSGFGYVLLLKQVEKIGKKI